MTEGSGRAGTTLRGWVLGLGLALTLAVVSPTLWAQAQTPGLDGTPNTTSSDALTTPPPGELTLGEVYRLAALRNPRLSATRSVVEASATMEASAALPPDPLLEIGAMNFSVPGFSGDMPTSMTPSIRAMQVLPFPGKLGLRGRIAEQGTAIHQTRADEARWEVRTRVARAFYEIYAVDRELVVMRETLGLLGDFERVAQSMYGAGTGRQADVLRAGVEIARMEAEIERMNAMGAVARARLNALLDRPGDTPVPPVRRPPLPDRTPPVDTLRSWAEDARPWIEGGRLDVERAQTRAELARRDLWPDLSVGVEYGRRSTVEMGVEHMGSLMVGFTLPVFAGRRQLPKRDEAAAMERMARAELTERRARVDGDIAGAVADLERARTLIALFESDVLPQARANVESAFSSYRVGTVDFMTLVDAQMSVNRFEAELHRLVAEYGRAVAELEMTLGREIPLPADLTVEGR